MINENIKKVIMDIFSNRIVQVVLVLIISAIIYKVLKYLIDKNTKKIMENKNIDSKKKTYIRVFHNLIKYVFFLLVFVEILQLNGIDVTAIITGVGVAGIIIGFALQDTLKDLIMGINIIVEDFYRIGDVVKYNNIQGKVVFLGLKSTKIKDLDTDDIVSIANRNIDRVSKVSNWFDINIPVSYDLKAEEVENVILKISNEVKENEEIQDCKYEGITDFADSSIKYKIRVFCNPENKLSIRRKILRVIKVRFDENNIKIPYMQVDIHNID